MSPKSKLVYDFLKYVRYFQRAERLGRLDKMRELINAATLRLLTLLCCLFFYSSSGAGPWHVPYYVPGYWGPWCFEAHGRLIERVWLDPAGSFYQRDWDRTGRWTWQGRQVLLVWDDGTEWEQLSLIDLDHALLIGVKHGALFRGKAFR